MSLHVSKTDWSAYVSYRCYMGGCQCQCINRRDSEPAKNRLCWDCWKQHEA